MIKVENTDKQFLNIDSGWKTNSNYSYCQDTTSFIKLDFIGSIDVYFQANSDCGYVNIYFDEEETPIKVNAGGNGKSTLIYSKTFDDSYIHRIRICNYATKVTAFDYFMVSEAVPYGEYDIQTMFDKRYLIRSNSIVYTVVDGALIELGELVINADTFLTYGFDTSPEWSIMSHLVNPEVFLWYDTYDKVPEITVNMSAAPLNPQNIITNAIDLTDPTITGIELMTVNCEGNPLFAVSFDSKSTWHAWNGETWSIVSEEFSGMTKELLESVTYDNWMLLYTGASSFYIRATITNLEDKLTEVYVDFAN